MRNFVFSSLVVLLVVLFDSARPAAYQGSNELYRIRDAKLISVAKGLDDSVAIVGQLFEYNIGQAFSGNIVGYQVDDATTGELLPRWLGFDAVQGQFFGVPRPRSVDILFVRVTALGPSNTTHRSIASDVFSIDVRSEVDFSSEHHHDPSHPEVSCKGQKVELFSFLLKSDQRLSTMSPWQRVSLIRKTVGAFEPLIQVNQVRLWDSNYEEEHFRRQVIMAGIVMSPNLDNPKLTSDITVAIRLGCGDQFYLDHFELIRTLRSKVENDHVSGVVGFPVTQYSFASVTYDVTSLSRQKRQRNSGAANTIDEEGSGVPAVPGPVVGGPVDVAPVIASSTLWPSVTRTTTQRTTTPTPNLQPKLNKNLAQSQFKCWEGQLCVLSLPGDLFLDPEDGYDLNYGLTVGGNHHSDSKLVSFDQRSKQIKVIAMERALLKMVVTAVDSMGAKSTGGAIAIQVTVVSPERSDSLDSADNFTPRPFPNHMFTVGLNGGSGFKDDMQNKILFIDKLEEKFKSQLSKVSIQKQSKEKELKRSDVILTKFTSAHAEWFVNPYAFGDRCDRSILEIWKIMTSSGDLDDNFANSFPSIVRPSVAKMSVDGQCKVARFWTGEVLTNVEGVVLPSTTTLVTPVVDGKIDATTQKPNLEDDNDKKERQNANIYTTMIIPIVVIVVLVIIAAIVACCFWRRNRRRKHVNLHQAKFLNKGKPMVFVDEMDTAEPTANSPMLLKNELGPMSVPMAHGSSMDPPPAQQYISNAPPPPSHTTSAWGTASSIQPPTVPPHGPLPETSFSQPGITTAGTLSGMNPLYQPPPAVDTLSSRDSGRSPRAKPANPHQRDPPPYIKP